MLDPERFCCALSDPGFLSLPSHLSPRRSPIVYLHLFTPRGGGRDLIGQAGSGSLEAGVVHRVLVYTLRTGRTPRGGTTDSGVQFAMNRAT